MKLPDFYSFDPLNRLKQRMGIARSTFGDLTVLVDPARLTTFELEKLTSQDGLDISIDDLRFLSDGTLAYKNSRVLLYIRDVAVYGGRHSEPRYHLAKCATLIEMQKKKKFSTRYVVSVRVDGQFRLNFIDGSTTETKLQNLSVCQNCLGELAFNGFLMNWGRAQRIAAVAAFKLEEFFGKYPRTLHTENPKYNSDNAPLNNYPDDFSVISGKAKAAANWICQKCKIDVSAKPNRNSLLHTHHINSVKSDNSLGNLEVLCVKCHVDEHPHMKGNPGFQAALRELQS